VGTTCGKRLATRSVPGKNKQALTFGTLSIGESRTLQCWRYKETDPGSFKKEANLGQKFLPVVIVPEANAKCY